MSRRPSPCGDASSPDDGETADAGCRRSRQMKLFGPRYPPEIAARVPPGQRLVKGWPVLQYGPIPRFDEASWDFKVFGLVESPYTLSYAELKALGPATIRADMHCVTGWTTLDNDWLGIPFSLLAGRAGPKPEAQWIIT